MGTENSRDEQRGELLRRWSGTAMGICSRKELERSEHARYRYPHRIPRQGTARAFAATKAPRSFRERCSRCRIRVKESLGLEFRGVWVGCGIVQDRPKIYERVVLAYMEYNGGGEKEDLGLPRVEDDQAASGDGVAIVDVILCQTMGDTLSDNA